MNSHQFKQAAKKFRAGRISLTEFESFVFEGQALRKSNEQPATQPPAQPTPTRAQVAFELVAPVAAGSQTAADDATAVSGVELKALVSRLTSRDQDAHKGDFGRVLAIGGSEGMPGAISLTGMAALRSGSGMVKLAVPEMIQAIVAATNPCLMTIGCSTEGDGFHGASEGSLSHHSEWADVIAIGPGMGRGGAQQWILKNLYAQLPQPLVVDADGLNALADADADLAKHEGQRVLTPHPGEFCRLIGQNVTSRQELEQRAKELATANQTVVVLKGRHTYVTDGENEYRNQTGNPGWRPPDPEMS